MCGHFFGGGVSCIFIKVMGSLKKPWFERRVNIINLNSNQKTM